MSVFVFVLISADIYFVCLRYSGGMGGSLCGCLIRFEIYGRILGLKL